MERKLFFGMAFCVSIFFWSSQVSLATYRDDHPNFDGTLIDQDTTWTKDGQYAFNKEVRIVDGAKLSIEPGTQVSIDHLMVLDGYIVAEGTETEPIHFTKQETDFSRVPAEYAPYDKGCYYTPSLGTIEFSSFAYDDSEPSVFRFVEFDGMGASESYESGNCPWSVGMFRSVQNFFTKTANASGIFSSPVLKITAGRVRIEHSTFKGNHFADIETDFSVDDEEYWYDEISVTDSNFEENTENMAVIAHIDYDGDQDFSGRVLLKNNWYGSPTGPMTELNPAGQGEQVTGTFQLDGWSHSKHSSVCTENCHSNVMFLPGLMGSRLYDDTNSSCIDAKADPKRVWEPNCNSDARKLYMDSDGKSLDSDIHTKEGDILDEVSLGFNIYQSFMDRMDALRDIDHSIRDWKPISYDWRLSYDDILADGSIENTLKILAEGSDTGKVTLIAHSNGGLLAKALMRKLGDAETARLVDKVIFVAVPQTGTPEAIAGMLNGERQNIFPVMDTETARGLAENMPGAYQLLPSEKYFSAVGTPAVTFDIADSSDLKGVYGDPIDLAGELHDFLLDSHRRVAATDDDTDIPTRLNGGLLNNAESTHDALDNWSAPSGVQVMQIAGWGVPATIKGVRYASEKKRHCDGSVCATMDFLSLDGDMDFTLDGDGTVVFPSALYMGGAERYWVNLRGYNKDNPFETAFGLLKVVHKDILEIPELNTFIADSITNTPKPIADYRYLSSEVPHSDDEKRIQYSLHSPLTLDLYDAEGRHTGMTSDGNIEEQIPGTYYRQFGDVKYIFADESSPMHISMSGYDTGRFTFSVKESQGDTVLGKVTFKDMPTTPQTKVFFDMPGDLEYASDLRIDLEGDGTVEHQLRPKIGEIVTLEEKDIVPPVTTSSLSDSQGMNGWFMGDVTAGLVATDNANGSGIEKTEYSLNDGDMKVYTEPFVISAEGTTNIRYFSTDKAGNKEEVKTQAIKIDKTAPEAKIAFNSVTQKLDISGIDSFSNVSVVILEKPELTLSNKKMKKIKNWFSHWHEKHRKNLPDMLATLTDDAGHTTSLSFEKTRDRNGFLFVRLQSIGYDGDESTLRNSEAQYKWKIDRKGKYQFFVARLRNGSAGIESHYIPRKDETWIMERPVDLQDNDRDDESERRPIRKKLSGMVMPYMESDNGGISVKY